ncbi:MAG: permease prefix domain 1-containing protein [Verrucomicrobiota bacterium]|jgi:hypothetical protein
MPETAVIGQFERRLVELGCPARQARDKARELSDHLADLKQAAMEEGLSEAEAEARAAAQLGEPSGLAERLACIMRQSSWWGRHPVIGFCLLPLFGFVPVWLLCGAILAGVLWLTGHIFGPAYLVTVDTAHALALDPKEFLTYSRPLNAMLHGAAIAGMAGLFCWLARRSVSGLKWILTACAVCSFSGAFSWAEIAPDSIGLGWGSSPNWLGASIPWLVAAAAWMRQRQTVRRLPVLAGPSRSLAARQRETLHPLDAGEPWVNKFLTTPTYWISTPVLAGILALGLLIWSNLMRGRAELLQGPARAAALRTHTWPAESAAVIERIQSRQLATAAENQTMIDLQPYVNVGLTTPTSGVDSAPETDLAGLPRGIHTFGGVSFDVTGKIQLMGRGLLSARRIYPVIRKNIPISQKCRQIHLLHGASQVMELDVTVAKLVLHYADGSTREIAIVAGEHLLDWRGPIYTTPAAGEQLAPKDRGTELAWVGNDSLLPQPPPLLAARIYRTTFPNPQPEVEIASVDYVSTLTGAAPFLAGLTVEK